MTRPIETLADAITLYDDAENAVVVRHELFDGENRGVIEVEWSVPGQMALSGQVTDLDVGTYYLKHGNQIVADANNHELQKVKIPMGARVTKAVVTGRVTKVGSGSITPQWIGANTGTVEAMSAMPAAAAINDELSALGTLLTTGLAEEPLYLAVAIASDVVTAGAFRLLIEYDKNY